jgi:hypothetical protein
MPDGLKEKVLTMLGNQTPRVLIAVVTIGAVGSMQWFGKATDVTTVTIGAVGCFALLMNWLIVKQTGKETK